MTTNYGQVRHLIRVALYGEAVVFSIRGDNNNDNDNNKKRATITTTTAATTTTTTTTITMTTKASTWSEWHSMEKLWSFSSVVPQAPTMPAGQEAS